MLEPVSQSVSQSIKQSINQAIIQSSNQAVNQAIDIMSLRTKAKGQRAYLMGRAWPTRNCMADEILTVAVHRDVQTAR